MVDEKNQKMSEQDEHAGAFVEIALTNIQVSQAIAEEVRLGIRDGNCAFLETEAVLPATLTTTVKG